MVPVISILPEGTQNYHFMMMLYLYSHTISVWASGCYAP